MVPQTLKNKIITFIDYVEKNEKKLYNDSISSHLRGDDNADS